MSQIEINQAEESKRLLDNPAFKRVMQRMGEYLDAKILSCDVDNKEQTQRVVLARQILAGIRREIERDVQNGSVSQIQMDELDAKRIKKLIR